MAKAQVLVYSTYDVIYYLLEVMCESNCIHKLHLSGLKSGTLSLNNNLFYKTINTTTFWIGH
jgi:hypothetical protein